MSSWAAWMSSPNHSPNWIVIDQPELRDRLVHLGIPGTWFEGHWSSQLGSEKLPRVMAVLEWRVGCLQLRPLDKVLGNPIKVDFLSGKTGFRSQRAHHEMIVKAVAGRTKGPLQVWDASAGLGRDSFILAAAGFSVVAMERNPVIACLLKDGLDRAQMNVQAAEVAERIAFYQRDSIAWLENGEYEQAPDVIYLDPMFPERTKSALVKKEMRIFRELVGEDSDGEKLLHAALQTAIKRVVVKRPRKAPPVGALKPSHQLMGKSSRFDVYQI